MKCPYCGNEMERGSLFSEGYNITLTPDLFRLTSFPGERDVCLAKGSLFLRRAETPAELCRACRKVIVDYEE